MKLKNVIKLAVLLFAVSSAWGQKPAGTPLAITNLTVKGGNAHLLWRDYKDEASIDRLSVYARNSLLSSAEWTSVTNVPKTVCDVTVSLDGEPTRFFGLFADLLKEITVAFDLNENVRATCPDPKTVVVGRPYGALPAASCQGGFAFDGWFTQPTGGSEVTAETTVTTDCDHSLYAYWTANEVAWNPDTLSVTVTNDTENAFTVHAAEGAEVAFTYSASATPEGIRFDDATREVTVAQGMAPDTYGFTVSAEPSNGRDTLHLGVTVVVEPKIVGVTFDPGIGTASFTSANVTWSQSYGTLPTATHGSYTFAGWWTDATGGTQVLPETTVTARSGHTLYARWAYLGAPDNLVVLNNASATRTIPVALVSPAGASLAFSSYNTLAYKGGVAGNALPSGQGSSGAAWAMSYNAAAREITIPAGTSVGRYQLYATVQVTSVSPALTLTSPSFTIETREQQMYWIDSHEKGAKNEWSNSERMYKTVESDESYAETLVLGVVNASKVMYTERARIGNEQPANVRPVASSVSIRAWRSTKTNNDNNTLQAYVEIVEPSWAKQYVMTNNATNPDEDQWRTITNDAIPLIPQGGVVRIGFAATNSRAGGTRFRVAWANFTVTWAPPATGITY